jgi:hypothetical protein
MNATASLRVPEALHATTESPAIGKDLLELLSSAMYENPLTLYREFVQNAADSIDEAVASGVLAPDEALIEVSIDPASREIRIRDNGAGISAETFAARMCSVGSSTKRGTEARGFRGVGRLSGLAYAQRVTFRSRASSEEGVREISWDCRKLRTGLKDDKQTTLSEFIEEITDIQDLDGDWPERFFEVELSGVVRYGDDRLVRPEAVSDYLAQVAPIPLSPEFALAADIDDWLDPVTPSGKLRLTINGSDPIFRPYRDIIDVERKPTVQLRSLETFEVPAIDGGIAARGWIAHHEYNGAIPDAALVKGLRVRVGNIQVGSSTVLEEIFPEPRFGSWGVGEVHIFDKRIVPNGRRDGFEQNVHFSNLLNHLAPVGRNIARHCRSNSSARQRRRTFEAQAISANQKLEILGQYALNLGARASMIEDVESQLAQMERIALTASRDEQEFLQTRVAAHKAQLAALADSKTEDPLAQLSGERGDVVREIIGLIYECSADAKAAKGLVDRILSRLT